MFTIITRKIPLLSRQDIWFYNNQPLELKGNNLFYHAFSLPRNQNIVELNTVYTTSINLDKTQDKIKSTFKKKLRGYINKGARTNFKYHILDISKLYIQNELLEYYMLFAQEKNLEPINKEWFYSACNSGYMTVSQIYFEDKPLITHIYLHDKERSRLQFSFHLPIVKSYNGQFQSLANRYLHWLDIIYFKENSFKIYDFGGIPVNSMASLREFKLSFGGIIEEQYNFIIPNGFYAIIYNLKQLLKKIKRGS